MNKFDGVDEMIAAMGAQVRAERERRKVSLRALARKLDISPSHLSLIERGRLRPSVEILWRIVSELSLSLDAVLALNGGSLTESNDVEASPVQRRQSRAGVQLAHGVSWERLTSRPDMLADFVLVHYDVGATSSHNNTQYNHAGREYGYVISGQLGLAIDKEEYVLEAGDSISFDAQKPHRQWAVGDEPVNAIWLVVRPNMSGAPSEQDTSRHLGLD